MIALQLAADIVQRHAGHVSDEASSSATDSDSDVVEIEDRYMLDEVNWSMNSQDDILGYNRCTCTEHTNTYIDACLLILIYIHKHIQTCILLFVC